MKAIHHLSLRRQLIMGVVKTAWDQEKLFLLCRTFLSKLIYVFLKDTHIYFINQMVHIAHLEMIALHYRDIYMFNIHIWLLHLGDFYWQFRGHGFSMVLTTTQCMEKLDYTLASLSKHQQNIKLTPLTWFMLFLHSLPGWFLVLSMRNIPAETIHEYTLQGL